MGDSDKALRKACPIGTTVSVHGLKNAAHLNAQYGEIVRRNADRVGVKFLCEEFGEKSIKRSNLVSRGQRFAVKVGSTIEVVQDVFVYSEVFDVAFGGDDKTVVDESEVFDDLPMLEGRRFEKLNLKGYYAEVVQVIGREIIARFKIAGTDRSSPGERFVVREINDTDAELLAKRIARHPGAPLIHGDRGGMLEIIRTTSLGDEDLCHIAAHKCYDEAYKRAPKNYLVRGALDDVSGPPGAEYIEPQQHAMLKEIVERSGGAGTMLTISLDQIKERWHFDLSHARRHVLWMNMSGVGHDSVVERLAGNLGWRFYQCYVIDEIPMSELQKNSHLVVRSKFIENVII